MPVLRVDVWSDIACPWCWVGKRNLEAAVAELDPAEVQVEVRWHAFELDPGASRQAPEDCDYVGRLAAKYRCSRAQAQAMIDRMVEVGRTSGIDFRFDRARPSNTFDAHRLLAWAADRGAQHALKERLFAAYLTEGRVIADREVLAEVAAEVGLDAERAQAILSTDAHADEVRADERAAGQLGISGVPFFIVDGRFGVPGAQPPDVLARVLREAAETLEPEPPAAAEACGPDGCEVPGGAADTASEG